MSTCIKCQIEQRPCVMQPKKYNYIILMSHSLKPQTCKSSITYERIEHLNVLQDTCKLKTTHTSHITTTNVISQNTSKATNCKSGNHKLEVVSIIIYLHKKPTNTSCQNLSKSYSNMYIKKLHN